MNILFHKDIAKGSWFTFSLAEQLGHIGSEVGRARAWQHRDEKLFQGAVERALELFDLTLADSRWRGRRREIARTREVFCDAALEGKEYRSSLQELEKYFFIFAMQVQNQNSRVQ